MPVFSDAYEPYTGTAVLVGGTKAVTESRVTANSIIQVMLLTAGGTVGAPFVASKTAGTGFTITSTSGTDTSTIAYKVLAW